MGIGVGQAVFDGAVTGLTYAILAAAFVLVYRATGVLNFALGQMGAFGVALLTVFAAGYHIPYWIALLLAVLLSALGGMIVELTVVRRLFTSPRLVLLIATIGVAQLFEVGRLKLPNRGAGALFPVPFNVNWHLPGSIVMSSRDLVVLIIAPVTIAALAVFMARSRFGLMVRASAANSDTARIYGISARLTSTIVWTIAGALAALTAIMLAPLQGVTPGSIVRSGGASDIGATLLLPALVASLIARMRSLPLTLVGGLVVGIGESLLQNSVDSDNASIVDLWIFVAVVVLVLFWVRKGREDSSWSLASRIKPIPERLQAFWVVRNLPVLGFAVLFVVLALIPLVFSAYSKQFIWTDVLTFAIMIVPISMLTGWAGQFSLGQYAFVGLGAVSMVTLTHGLDIPVPFDLWDMRFNLSWAAALVVATLVGAVVAFVVGLPALRIRGMLLGVVTLAFAVAASNWLFEQPMFTGSKYTSVTPLMRPPKFAGIDFANLRNYYYLCLFFLVVVTAMMLKIRRSGLGRAMIAMSNNEDAATAATVSAKRMKLAAFVLAGACAAFGGCLYITLRVQVNPGATFTPDGSLQLLAGAVIGGLGSVVGPIMGALYVRGLPALFGASDTLQLLTSSIGLLFLLMYFPGGLSQIVYSIRDVLLRFAQRRLGPGTPASIATAAVVREPARRNGRLATVATGDPWLQLDDVRVRFGGIHAVDGVSLQVGAGELVGLIGTNGAGKSTLMNAISGLVPAQGRISVLGREVSRLAAYRRHRVGLGRSFQSARLYPDLTVRETIMVALEARETSYLIPSMTGLPPSPAAERRKRSDARDIIDLLGLGRYADHFIADLSTGTRRVVELGCLLAVDAKVLLLDEPTGGLAQRETEAFAPLIVGVRQEMGASMVVIEHDMPLIMGISDRVYCLEAGKVIAEGTPQQVRNDPRVVAAYLGTDERAIKRSNAKIAGLR